MSCIHNILSRNPVTKSLEVHLLPECVMHWVGRQHSIQLISSSGGIARNIDARYTEAVTRAFERLKNICDRKDFSWEVSIIRSQETNAWCAPGGKMAIHLGLIEELDKEKNGYCLEEKIAAVLSHEMIHAAARHGSLMIELFLPLIVLLFFLQQIFPFAKSIETFVLDLAAQKRSRTHEYEADRYGMLYLKRARYNPRAAVAMQQFFVDRFPEPDGWWGYLLSFFLTHPYSSDRLKANEQNLIDLEQGLLL